VKEVGRELGVRYVLEGGLHKAGNRIRVTAQLVEAETGKRVWAERYDRNLTDIFAVQDEVTEAVTIAIAPAIAAAEQQRALRKPLESLDAWAAYQRGLWHLGKNIAEDNALAHKFFRQAIDLDTNFGGGYRGHAYAQLQASAGGFRAFSLPETQSSAEGIVNLRSRGMLVVSVARRLGSGNTFARLLCRPLKPSGAGRRRSASAKLTMPVPFIPMGSIGRPPPTARSSRELSRAASQSSTTSNAPSGPAICNCPDDAAEPEHAPVLRNLGRV
jgi:hypothetical protein